MERRHFLFTGLLGLIAAYLPGPKVKVFEIRGDLNGQDVMIFEDDVARPEIVNCEMGREIKRLENGEFVHVGEPYFKTHTRLRTKLPDGTFEPYDESEGTRYTVLNCKLGLGELKQISEKYWIHRFVVI